MKKVLTLLTALVCVFCLSACGAQKEEIKPLISEEEAVQFADEIVGAMDEIYGRGLVQQYKEDPQVRATIQPWLLPALDSWVAASEDLGSLVAITGHTVEYSSEDDLVVKAFIQGSIRNAEVEIVIEDGAPKGVAVNVTYTFAEQMQKAGLNTLLGMGTVFSVLILISIIISLFKFIPDIQAAFSKKPAETAKPAAPAKPAAAPAKPSAPAPAPAVVPGSVDDPALIAVLAAAVAAYEGSTEPVNICGVCCNENVDTGDSYVVRSIRRVTRQ